MSIRSSVEAFLSRPEEPPYSELLDGEVLERPMPKEDHGRLVAELLALLHEYRRSHKHFRARPEVRHIDRQNSWIYLPDIAVTLSERLKTRTGDPVDVAPDFAIEVLSPEDRPGLVYRKAKAYLRAGTTILWLVDPQVPSVTIIQRGADPRTAIPGDVISAEPVLPGFRVDVAALFAAIEDE